MHPPAAEAFDSPLYVKVTATAKERLANLKARLIRAGVKATEQNIVDCLITFAEEGELKDRLPKKRAVRVPR
jgi:hypothetical protein